MRFIQKVLLAVIIILIVTTSLAGCTSTATKNITTIPQVGKLAPDFKYLDAKGNTLSLSDLRGSPVALNFWDTRCAPCRYEMPLLQALLDDNNKVSQGLVLLSVNNGESLDTVSAFMETNRYTFTVILDTNGIIANAYNIRYLPTTFFIGRDGIIQNIKLGVFLNESELEEALDSIMK